MTSSIIHSALFWLCLNASTTLSLLSTSFFLCTDVSTFACARRLIDSSSILIWASSSPMASPPIIAVNSEPWSRRSLYVSSSMSSLYLSSVLPGSMTTCDS